LELGNEVNEGFVLGVGEGTNDLLGCIDGRDVGNSLGFPECFIVGRNDKVGGLEGVADGIKVIDGREDGFSERVWDGIGEGFLDGRCVAVGMEETEGVLVYLGGQ